VSTGEMIVVAVAIFGAAFVFTLVAFGFALLAMPLMTLAIPVEQAVVVTTILGLPSVSLQAIQLRHHADRSLVKRLTGASIIGMLPGLVILNFVDDTTLRIVLGVSVLIATWLLWRQPKLSHVGPAFDAACGFVSGVLNTSLGTNGPPLVFDLRSRGLADDRFRGTIAAIFVGSSAVALTLFAINGKITAAGLEAVAVALPGWVLGLALGKRAKPHVKDERFKKLVLEMLFVTGATAILSAVV
jgi:uncharacterized membrane protein YfcA